MRHGILVEAHREVERVTRPARPRRLFHERTTGSNGRPPVRLRTVARYEIRNTADGAVLSKHRTRQGALDQWRERHSGKPVRIVRTYSDGVDRLVVEGVWHGLDDVADNALAR